MTDDPFVTHRSLLFTVAYELLGSAADAEDVLQESWLRWADVARDQVRDPRAFLVRIVTRQSLNHLRTVSRRRETYVGEWLPEPLLTSPDVADDVELAESVSIAMLTVLETLGPQIAHRAKDHVAARQPRMDVRRSEHEEAVERFVATLNTGDVQGLMDVLAPDVVSVADGGGKVRGAALRPIVGAERIARYLVGGLAKFPGEVVASAAWLNGQPGIRVDLDGQLAGVISLSVEGGQITRIFSMANPEKLGWLGEKADLAR